MKRYEVEHWVKHKKEFWAQDEKQIGEILCETNECRILSITELPIGDKEFAEA